MRASFSNPAAADSRRTVDISLSDGIHLYDLSTEVLSARFPGRGAEGVGDAGEAVLSSTRSLASVPSSRCLVKQCNRRGAGCCWQWLAAPRRFPPHHGQRPQRAVRIGVADDDAPNDSVDVHDANAATMSSFSVRLLLRERCRRKANGITSHTSHTTSGLSIRFDRSAGQPCVAKVKARLNTNSALFNAAG